MGCCYSRNKNNSSSSESKEADAEASRPIDPKTLDDSAIFNKNEEKNFIINYSLNRPARKKSERFDKKQKSLKMMDDDEKFFDYDSEAYKTITIKSSIDSENNMNSAREGPKNHNFSSSFVNKTIIIPKYNESDFESANESILDTSKIDTNLNDLDLNNSDIQNNKNNYISFSSNSILSQFTTPNDNKDNYIDLNGFSNKKYDFFYIEFHYFLLWSKEYLKSIYPDINFILMIEINDDKSSLEKIILTKSGDDRYFPQKGTNNNESFVRIMKVLNKDTPFDNNEFTTHKLQFTILNFTNNRYIPVCQEDIFISEKKIYEGMKIKFNQNLNMVHSSKKIGYILFNFAYKNEEFNKNELFEQKEKIYKSFCEIENTTKFVEEPLLIYRYYYIPNYYIKLNGSEAENKLKNNFSSIGDVQDTDFGGELQNEDITLNRLLELFESSKQAYDFYVVLKKISDYMSNSEFNVKFIFNIEKEEKSLKFKEKLYSRLKELLEIKNSDRFLISLIFFILKKLFFKTKKDNRSKSLKTGSTSFSKEAEMKQKLIESNKVQELNLSLMRNFLEISFEFLKEKTLSEEIPIAALNYIFRHYEDIVQNFATEGKRKLPSDEFFGYYIMIEKRYEVLCEVLVRYPENPSCVQVVLHIINKTIKYKKEDCKDLINYILYNIDYEGMVTKILKSHDCNSFIMTNLMYTMYYLVDIYKKDIELVFSVINFTKIREIFSTFRTNGFDQIHETLLYIIKNILMKRFDKNPNQEETVTDEEFKEIIIIMSLSLEFIKNKIQLCKDFYKLSNLLMNLLNYVYIICSIINGFPNKRKKICIEKKISEHVIDCLSAFNERKIFVSLDNAFKRYDISSLNTKTMVFRALFHCLQLIKALKETFPSTLTKPFAEKIYKVIRSISDNDSVYNPEGISKDIEKFYKNVKEENKIINTGLNNLKDYYLRYKKQEHEYVGEFLTICRS